MTFLIVALLSLTSAPLSSHSKGTVQPIRLAKVHFELHQSWIDPTSADLFKKLKVCEGDLQVPVFFYSPEDTLVYKNEWIIACIVDTHPGDSKVSSSKNLKWGFISVMFDKKDQFDKELKSKYFSGTMETSDADGNFQTYATAQNSLSSQDLGMKSADFGIDQSPSTNDDLSTYKMMVRVVDDAPAPEFP